jgi:hypothetical protein
MYPPLRHCPTLLHQLTRDVGRADHVDCLVDHEPVVADDVVHSGEVDPPEGRQKGHRLGEGGREPTHVAHHHGPPGPVPATNDVLGLAQAQAHRLFDQHVQAVLQRRRHGLGVILVAVEDEHGVEVLSGEHRLGVAVAGRDAKASADLLLQRRRQVAARAHLEQVLQ